MTIASQPQLSPEATTLAKWHAYAVFHLRQWRLRSFRPQFRPPAKGWDLLEHNYELAVSSVEEMGANGDLQRWARWATEEQAVDYLELD
jgi:hypothetical protein